jgi:hypothetical protein
MRNAFHLAAIAQQGKQARARTPQEVLDRSQRFSSRPQRQVLDKKIEHVQLLSSAISKNGARHGE